MQDFRQPSRRQGGKGGDMDAPAPQLDEAGDVRHGVAKVGQQPARQGLEQLAFLRQHHPPRTAIEQLHGQRRLQGLDQCAECGLGQMACLRGLGEVAQVGKHDEGAQLAGGQIGLWSH
ncbi:Uncharacterised protein [Bordetella pertussis]|nr:Uncharacterised protein [Bordetella pertussis]